MKREFVQLAHRLKATKQHIGGWYWSEKLDGQRCYWDGGISRGIPKIQVPWANNEKDERYQEAPIATGLWSRYGNVIHAPDWFLNELPKAPLDSEIYIEGYSRQQIMSVIKKLIPDDTEWEKVEMRCFDMPPYQTIFADGTIDNVNYHKVFKDIVPWAMKRVEDLGIYAPTPSMVYQSTYFMLKVFLEGKEHKTQLPFVSKVATVLTQYELPYPQKMAIAKIADKLAEISEAGGEGLMVRDPNAVYVCERSHKLLKEKDMDDDEGTVVGYVTGRETDKGSKLLGLMGALILDYRGQRLELSGFTDQERTLKAITKCSNYEVSVSGYVPLPSGEIILGDVPKATEWATENPETECPDWVEAIDFPRGSVVSFKYRGLSDTGIPNEARYWRKDERI